MSDVLYLSGAARYADAALLAMRVLVGGFLVWGVWDNITSAERMQEFVLFLAKYGFPWPQVAARLSVWAQFFVGLSFIAGLFTRWAGWVCIVNFAIAIAMVDRFGGIRASFASACLIVIGLYLATHGPGRFAVDWFVQRRAAART
jgi:putative oxidoreductase